MRKRIYLLSAGLLSFAACQGQTGTKEAAVPKAKYEYGTKAIASTAKSTLAEQFFSAAPGIDKKVDELWAQMNSSQKAAQMIMVASSEPLGFPYATSVKSTVSKDQAANVLFLKGSKTEFIRQNKELKQFRIAGLQPLFACDCEPTLFHNKFTGEKKMLATASLKTQDAVNSSVDTINKVMDEMGIVVNFAPIVDIAANKAVINKRAFSDEPSVIEDLAGTFINRTQADNKAATIKHFPGHGAVVGDTHKQSVLINGKMTELKTFDNILKKDKPVFVMVGHISVKNNPEGFNTENGRPATASKKIITDLLRNKLNFQGIVVTDAMNMQASKNFTDADWESAKAGADLVLMPLDAAKLNKQIAAEIEKGSALGKQFEASVKRILRLKVISQGL
ncbi:MAG: glycoside hydrolase family 3 protein [Sphingobacteriales bacterium]|nr:MAG: glycoside hydrolase family 3 protein [Sphingobacteriales bacterium]